MPRWLRDLQEGPAAPLDALGRAADNLEAAASEAAGAKPSPRGSAWDGLGLRDWLVVGSMSIVGFSGQFLLLVFLVYFLLASGDLFKRKIVRLAGPELSARRTTVETLDDIRLTLERFTLVVIATNAIVGVASYFAFRSIGFANAGLWAVVGGLLNTVPYVGSAVTTAVIFLVGLLQYDRLDMASLAAGLFLIITTVEGMLLTPWWMGRTGRLNNPAVFTGLLFWGWLWGAWGMLLAYPILMVIKVVADHVDRFNAVGELLGE
jgi:predicted PurR-regulated permease PerM